MEKPFKDREEMEKEIRRCGTFTSILVFLGLGSAAIGFIGDAFNITLIVEPMSWFLLAIFFIALTIIPGFNVLDMRLCGIEAENKIE